MGLLGNNFYLCKGNKVRILWVNWLIYGLLSEGISIG